MPVRVGINGFGRIGRLTLRTILQRHPDIEVVAINDLTDVKTNAHLFKWDSTFGPFAGEVATEDKMAWVGVATGDSMHPIYPAAHAGFGQQRVFVPPGWRCLPPPFYPRDPRVEHGFMA